MQRSDANDPPGTVTFVTRQYDAYGHDDSSAHESRTGFAGSAIDAYVPWYTMGNRMYAPTLRRFILPDASSPFDAGGLNRYAYCGGDPINRIDPTGDAWWDWLGAALGLVGAIVGIAATGGALLGVLGAAAAGSLTAAVSTTAMATMTAAVVLDVASVAVEIGSIVSLATGDGMATGIFGWIALGTGLASAGLAGVATLAKHAPRLDVRRAGRARSGFTELSTKHKPDQGYSRATFASSDKAHRIKFYQGKGAVRKKIPDRADMSADDIVGIDPVWTEVTNAQAGINYLADVEIVGEDLVPLMRRIGRKNDNLPVMVLSGVDGMPHGDNWSMGRRQLPNPDYFNQDNANSALLSGHAGRSRPFSVHDLRSISEGQFATYTQTKAHVVHAYCYGVADRQVMRLLGIPFSRTFKL